MSEETLRSYRLSSLEDPTDEMLHALMEKVAQSARASTAKALARKARMMNDTMARIKAKAKKAAL